MSWLLYHGPKRHVTMKLDDFDVVLTTYDILRSEWANYGALYSRTWARIILDEGECRPEAIPLTLPLLYLHRGTSASAYLYFQTAHKIRNRASQIFQAACEVPAQNRWCLTGPPIQNTLDDYGALLAFVGVPPFTTGDQFRFWVSAPILANRVNALRMLRGLVGATCLRRTKAQPSLAGTLRLPRKMERVESVELAERERELYDFFKRRSYLLACATAPDAKGRPTKRRKRRPAEEETAGRKTTGSIVVLLSVLRMICDHGGALLPRAAREAWEKREATVVGWDVLRKAAGAGRPCSVCGREGNAEDAEGLVRGVLDLECKKHVVCEGCAAATSTEEAEEAVGVMRCPKCRTASPALQSMLPSSGDISVADGCPSSKLSALMHNVLVTTERGPDGNSPVKRYVFVACSLCYYSSLSVLGRD